MPQIKVKCTTVNIQAWKIHNQKSAVNKILWKINLKHHMIFQERIKKDKRNNLLSFIINVSLHFVVWITRSNQLICLFLFLLTRQHIESPCSMIRIKLSVLSLVIHQFVVLWSDRSIIIFHFWRHLMKIIHGPHGLKELLGLKEFPKSGF